MHFWIRLARIAIHSDWAYARTSVITPSIQHVRSITCQATQTEIQMKRKQVNKYIAHVWDEANTNETKPLVVMFGWLMAKDKYFTPFYDYYLSRNFDIVRFDTKARHVMLPFLIKPAIRNFMDYLSSQEHCSRPIIFHSFSVGGSTYSNCLLQILAEPEKYGLLRRRLVGHVSDSLADLSGLNTGFGRSISNIEPLAKFIGWSVQTYVEAFPKKVYHPLQLSSETFRDNPLSLPTQFIHSCNDIINEPTVPKEAMKKWPAKNIPVFYHEFDTPHCEHFRYNPEKYAEILDTFLEFLKLRNSTQS